MSTFRLDNSRASDIDEMFQRKFGDNKRLSVRPLTSPWLDRLRVHCWKIVMLPSCSYISSPLTGQFVDKSSLGQSSQKL